MYYTAERLLNGILVWDEDKRMGWIFRQGDIGYGWAQRLLQKSEGK